MAGVSVRVRMAIRVQGIVEGVGFRPFVYSLATSLGLAGLVGNDTDDVLAQVEGPEPAVAEFVARLLHCATFSGRTGREVQRHPEWTEQRYENGNSHRVRSRLPRGRRGW